VAFGAHDVRLLYLKLHLYMDQLRSDPPPPRSHPARWSHVGMVTFAGSTDPNSEAEEVRTSLKADVCLNGLRSDPLFPCLVRRDGLTL